MNQSIRTCCVCSSSIQHLRSLARYCSQSCAERARRDREPGRRSAQGKESKRKALASATDRVCATAGCSGTVPARAASGRLYCSTQCRDKRYRNEVHSIRYAPGSDLKAHHRRISAAWKKNHALANRLHKAQRDARKRTTQVAPITATQLSARFSFFGFRCWMCGGPWEHIDHVKPLAKGGPHILANLRPSCRACNQSKNDTWPLERLI